MLGMAYYDLKQFEKTELLDLQLAQELRQAIYGDKLVIVSYK